MKGIESLVAGMHGAKEWVKESQSKIRAIANPARSFPLIGARCRSQCDLLHDMLAIASIEKTCHPLSVYVDRVRALNFMGHSNNEEKKGNESLAIKTNCAQHVLTLKGHNATNTDDKFHQMINGKRVFVLVETSHDEFCGVEILPGWGFSRWAFKALIEDKSAAGETTAPVKNKAPKGKGKKTTK